MRKRKIKFPLVLKNDVKVRTLEDLQQNFDLEKILAYYENGKLETWLRDRYEDDIAEQVGNIDRNSPEAVNVLCSVLGVSADNTTGVSLADVRLKNEKLDRVKQISDESEVINNYQNVAFSQEELDSIIASGVNTVYIYGESFKILPNTKSIRYVGLNKPKIDFDGHRWIEYHDNGIVIENTDVSSNGFFGIKPRIGDQITFGKYNDQPIEWVVLYISNNTRALVISKDILDIMPYDISCAEWSKSSLKKWLNQDFYSNSFNSFEKKYLTTVREDSDEIISILSGQEINQYCIPPSYLKANPTPFAKSHAPNYLNQVLSSTASSLTAVVTSLSGFRINKLKQADESSWWVKDTRTESVRAYWVNKEGSVETQEPYLKSQSLGVRPAMWLMC